MVLRRGDENVGIMDLGSDEIQRGTFTRHMNNMSLQD